MTVAACFSSRSSDWAATVQRMLRAQRLPEDSPGCVFPVAGGAIGWTQPAGRRSPLPALYRSRCGSLLAVTGLPIDISGASIERRLGAAVEAGGEEVTRELKQLDGVFAALFWDAPAGTLHVVTDILGLQPLYSFRQPGLLLLSAGQRGLTASGLLKVESDPAGWGAFIDLGNVLGETTQLKGIRRVDPGAVWTFDPRQDRLERTPYWHWPERDPGLKHAGLDTGALLTVLDREIQAYLGHCPETTVLLSGGGDSRFLTAMLLRNGVRPAALTVKHSDELLGADHRFAAQVGRRHCSEFLALTPPRDFFSSPDYLDYLEATEAGAQSLYLFIAAVGALIGEHRPAVWDGLLPGITVTGYFRRARTPAELLEKVCAPRNSRRWRGACMVFEKGLADGMYGESQAALRQEAARYPADMNGVNQFWVRNRTRVRTGANPCRVYARRSLAYTPCVSKEFWSMIMPLPCEEREHHLLYSTLFARHFTEVRPFPLCSRGIILNAPSASWSERLYAKAAAATSNYYAGRAMVRLGLRRELWWDESRLLDAVIAQVDPGHPELNPDGVRRLQSSIPEPGSAEAEGRLWLFYWQVWRWLMQGQLPQARQSLFAARPAKGAWGDPASPAAD